MCKLALLEHFVTTVLVERWSWIPLERKVLVARLVASILKCKPLAAGT